MCGHCKTAGQPLFTKILPNGQSVVLCGPCIRQSEAEFKLQLQTVSEVSVSHYCRVGLQYQSLRPRLLRARTAPVN
jgi:hypothetical protein